MATTKTKTKTIAGTTGSITLAGILIWLASLGGGGSPPPTTTTVKPTITVATTARPTTAKPTTTSTTTSTPGTQSADRSFGAPDASWNQPVSKFGFSPDLQQYASRWWWFGGGGDVPGYVNVAGGEYGIPVYSAANATTIARAYQVKWAQELYVADVGATLPWNPAWKPGTGNDNLMTIIDYKTGTVWSIGGIGQLPINCIDGVRIGDLRLGGPNTRNDYDINNPLHLCSTGVTRQEGAYTFKDGSTVDGRGMGINQIALTVRAVEVRAGKIPHPLAMAITNTMFGPACSPIRGASAPGAGVSCGFFVPPATKLERINPNIGCAAQVVNDLERSKTIPEGMRFALDISDPEIDQWLDSRKYTGKIRSTARVFAVALRDYGWIIAETGCHGMLIQTDSFVEGEAAPIWRNELGLTGTDPKFPNADLIAGLITEKRVRVIQPPP